MPILQLPDGSLLTDLNAIAQELAPLSIRCQHFDPGTTLLFPDLPQQDTFTDLEKQHILDCHNVHFEFLRQQENYLWHDLLVLHPGSPNLALITSNYHRFHTHTMPEAIYALAGEAIYGFLHPEGYTLQLLVQPQDYLHIPAEIEHWFSPAASLHFKAVRYFTTASGWVPRYTGTQVDSAYLNG